ncbi:MAG: 2-phospho-L-lactate transferase [Pseudomonadales bacterium]|nr:2-phospho-L-lactate transferase [Pseudomonadales bacterium]
MTKKYLAITGGVGGAKLALGLSKLLTPQQLDFAVNTADDFVHLGMNISPDIDTLMYTLSGESNAEQGWGRRNETWQFMDALKQLGEDSWFNLGDKDLSIHITRTQKLKAGQNLTDITQNLYRQFAVNFPVWPMTNDSVSTFVETENGDLPFQDYFVKQQCAPRVSGFKFKGIKSAKLNPGIRKLLLDPDLTGVVLCPSNPYVSVDPMLALPEMRTLLKTCAAPVVAITPIISGQAIKGPTAKMMQELAMPSTAHTVARHYSDFLDGFVLDSGDIKLSSTIEELNISTVTAQTLMVTLQDRIQLAKATLDFIHKLRRS